MATISIYIPASFKCVATCGGNSTHKLHPDNSCLNQTKDHEAKRLPTFMCAENEHVPTNVNGSSTSNNDDATEVITLTGSAETSSGTTIFFQTITSATVSAQPAANVSLGITADVAGGVFAGRTRVRQANVGSGGAIGNVDFRNTGTAGTSLITLRTQATAGDISTVNIPQDGVLFDSGAYITFTETSCNAVTVYFDG